VTASARRTGSAVTTAPTALALCLAGLAVAGYLTVERHTAATTLAYPDTGVVTCRKVTRSAQSQVAGIPVAALGLAWFAAMVALNLPRMWRDGGRRTTVPRLVAAGAGVAFALYLIGAELFVLDAICLWCTAAHALAVAVFAVVVLGTALSRPAPSRRPS
jgi:uncharacterized membrane protein